MTTENGELIATWEAWLADLRTALIWIHHHREMWKAVTNAIYERVATSSGTWVNHYQRLYVDGQAMAIRRLIRASGSDTITIGRLLESMEKHASLLNVDRYVERGSEKYDNEYMLTIARQEFDELWGDGQGNLDLKRLRHDKAELNKISKKVIDLADLTIAHIVDGRPKPALTFGELDVAIDHTGKIFQHYAALITGTHFVLTPTVQDNWQETFYAPLFSQPVPWTPPDIFDLSE